ncbi:uncharacterized protein LOC115579694 isoform X2 [Sparus aurata]|uniref:uncharacterized protein LOC115579694 isoform X2 n=1 Tax=Sparus aurata TaxID=8175 RepID=UPI0011C19C82|nr:uncharacterized protein LOC115579694 isoform X2 [Sparus aurata]
MAFSKTFGPCTGPYNRLPTMTIKVIAVKEVVRVQNWDFKEGDVIPTTTHKNAVAAISDGKSVLKFTIFEDLAKQVEEGKSYIVKNYGLSKYGSGPRSVLSRKNTAMYFCAPVTVSSQLEEEGRRMLSPPSISVPIKNLQADLQHFLTLEPVQKHFGARGEVLPMRTVRIKEGEAEVTVVLWREAVIPKLTIGIPVKISHLKPSRSQYDYRLQSSSFTEIEVVTGAKEIAVKGIRMVPGGMEIIDDTDTEWLISTDVWGQSFPQDHFMLPDRVMVSYENGQITRVLKMET